MRTRGRRLRPTPLLHECRSEEQADGSSDCHRTDKDWAAEQAVGRPGNSVHVRSLSVGKVTKPRNQAANSNRCQPAFLKALDGAMTFLLSLSFHEERPNALKPILLPHVIRHSP